jgi:murein tripeptide amidase MpaA
VYFAYSIPYTLSDLRNDLHEIEDRWPDNIQRKVLCKTLAGEDCEVITITSKENLENYSKRKGVVLTSRVHPGETVGSWMMRGVLFFLASDNKEAKLLRDNFIFKVIPMLNPDGVVNGNYRCSLAGCDLNRRWQKPHKVLQPVIWHVKRLCK